MSPPKRVGDGDGLLRRRTEDAHRNGPMAGRIRAQRLQLPVMRHRLRRQPGQGQPGRHGPRRGDELGARPPAPAQREHLGALTARTAKPLGKIEDPADVCPAEAIDRLVRIADDDQLRTSRCQRPSTSSCAGSVSWYSSTTINRRSPATSPRTSGVPSSRAVLPDQPRVVDRGLPVEVVEIVGVERCE